MTAHRLCVGHGLILSDGTPVFKRFFYNPPMLALISHNLTQVVAEGGVFYGYPCDGEKLVSAADCAPNGAEGLETYYSILLPAGRTITATLNHAADGVLRLLGGCTEPYPCFAFADGGIARDPETLSYVNTTTGNLQVYLVVDSFHPNSCGAYDLEIVLTPGSVPA